jgi:hypothetical protein
MAAQLLNDRYFPQRCIPDRLSSRHRTEEIHSWSRGREKLAKRFHLLFIRVFGIHRKIAREISFETEAEAHELKNSMMKHSRKRNGTRAITRGWMAMSSPCTFAERYLLIAILLIYLILESTPWFHRESNRHSVILSFCQHRRTTDKIFF